MKKLVIIDSNAIIHRSYHALPKLTTPQKELVNAVYGFSAVLIKIIKELNPDYLICAFDVAGPTFRNKIYKDYKAKRIKPPQDLYDQIDRVKQVVKAFGAPVYEKKRYEADDIIGTIVDHSEKSKKDIENIIVTGDGDALQLVSSKTKVYFLQKGIKNSVIYDVKMVKQRYGFLPQQLTDYKGLRGDASDNILGVPGIGEKTATDLIIKYKSLKNLYSKIEKQSNDKNSLNQKTIDKLLEYKEQALESLYLATIKKDVPIKFNLLKAQWQGSNVLRVAKLFKELGFKSLIDRIPQQSMI
jgi:DNA polymerase-1